MTASGQRVGKGTPGGMWNNIRGTVDIITKGSQTTNRILGCEDQCNIVLLHLYNLKTTSGYRFENVVSHHPPLFLRHVTILATPTIHNGAPVIHLDPLYNNIEIDW